MRGGDPCGRPGVGRAVGTAPGYSRAANALAVALGARAVVGLRSQCRGGGGVEAGRGRLRRPGVVCSQVF